MATINTFTGIPLTRYIFNSAIEEDTTYVVQSLINDHKSYFAESNQRIIGRFPSANEFRNQTLFQKTRKYVLSMFELFRLLLFKSTKRRVQVYCMDYFVLYFSLLLKRTLIPSLRIVYHQFEMVEEDKANMVELFFMKRVYKQVALVDLAIFPEVNRRNFFLERVNCQSLECIILPNTNDIRLVKIRPNNNSKIVIGHIGSVSNADFLFWVLEALTKESGAFEFWQVGAVNEEALKIINAFQNQVHIKYIGHVPHDRLVDYYSAIDIGLIMYSSNTLNTYYCAPNKLYEYWAYGVPILAHRVPGLNDLNAKREFLELVDMTRVEDILDGLYRITTSTKEAVIENFLNTHHLDNYTKEMKMIFANGSL